MFLLVIAVGYVLARHVKNANKIFSRVLFLHNSVNIVGHKKQRSQNGVLACLQTSSATFFFPTFNIV